MAEFPVKLGSILFTLVEPHRGHEVDYNRWYERDHFYAGCLVGPGILAGKRWVAPVPYKELRATTEEVESDPTRGSYLALYWIERSQSVEWGMWSSKEVHKLHAAGRMFPDRDHIHTKMYRYDFGVTRDADGVPPELALDHPYRGLGVVIGEVEEGADRRAALDWYREEMPHVMAGSPAAMALLFTPIPIPDSAPADIPRIPSDPRRFLMLTFLESDPMECWDSLFGKHTDQVAQTGLARALWSGPFIPTIPGTDTYTDQLW